ncbi:MAG: glutathione S-transferase family protein [Alphaproteobacteria bacterium]|nr:glutathione S-transferase family protein [Alphaproteobacteria bacterium]
MVKVWGRDTSSNVQKVMWAAEEIGLKVERIDVGGPYGKNREAAYLAMNPNGLVPTLEEEDGFTLWESNSIVRYLAAKHKSSLEPADLKQRASAQKWMDWQLSVMAPAIIPMFLGLVRTPPAERNMKAIEESRAKTGETARMLDEQLGKTQFVAGDAFSYGDIPVGIMAWRYRELSPGRPALKNFDRWFAAIAARPGFKKHVAAIAFK